MQVSKIQSANNVNFNARFIENAKYKELYQYAKQQKTFPKFEKVIKHLATLPNYLVKLDYGKTKIQQELKKNSSYAPGSMADKKV